MKWITVHEITTGALLLSVIFVLSALEGMLPPLPLNMRFGLSNVVTMYALFFIGKRQAFILAGLKSLFVFASRGPIAGLLSLSGGFASLAVITLIAVLCPNVSYFVLSIAGALTHNMAQLSAASWLVSTNLLMVYMPVLAVAGIAAGSLTAALLRVVMPIFKSVPEDGAEVSQT